MNIYVCIKQVPDTETKIKIKEDKSGIDTTGVKWIMSPYDEFAVEEALRLKEKTPGSTVTVLSAGPARVSEAIRTALAMGADSGIQIDIPETADSNLAARALSGALKKQEKVDAVFTGKEAIDDGAAQVSQLIGEYLGIPTVTVILAADYQDGKVRLKREVEGGSIEVLDVAFPAVIAAQRGMNEPRYASLPNIMKAKRKQIETLSMEDVGVSEIDQKIRIKNLELPPPKQASKKLEGTPQEQAKELVRILHEEVKVI
jgi:electron transfer flavoprotein beta subunit